MRAGWLPLDAACLGTTAGCRLSIDAGRQLVLIRAAALLVSSDSWTKSFQPLTGWETFSWSTDDVTLSPGGTIAVPTGEVTASACTTDVVLLAEPDTCADDERFGASAACSKLLDFA